MHEASLVGMYATRYSAVCNDWVYIGVGMGGARGAPAPP